MFAIDKMSRTPIYEQLIDRFELCILSGDIPEDGQLPSVRALSQSLGVNPNTLQRAYAEIERRGLCYTVPGNGRFITKDALQRLTARRTGRLSELEQAVAELCRRGVAKQDMIDLIERVYSQNPTVNVKEVIGK